MEEDDGKEMDLIQRRQEEWLSQMMNEFSGDDDTDKDSEENENKEESQSEESITAEEFFEGRKIDEDTVDLDSMFEQEEKTDESPVIEEIDNVNTDGKEEDSIEEKEEDESQDEEGETEDEEDKVMDLMDLQEQAFLSSSKSVNNDGLIDELGIGVEGDEEDDEEEDPEIEEKIPFNEALGIKESANKTGKLNKNKFLYGGLILFTVAFLVAFIFQKKKLNETKDVAKENDLNVNGYHADFGDFMNRGVSKENDKDKIKDLVDELDNMTGGAFKEDKPIETKPAPVQTYTPTYSGNSEAFQNANMSSLVYSTGGFGHSDSGFTENENNIKTGGTSLPLTYSQTQDASSYFNNLSTITDAMGVNKDKNYGDSKRYSTEGRYDKTVKAGKITMIPEYSIYPGTVLQAVMVSGINTDYPGEITARIISPVYDSKTGRNLLIPQGSILRGSYSSASIGISRVQIAWTDLIINRDGLDYMVSLGKSNAVDKYGYTGIKGTLNDHAFSYLKAAGWSSLFTMINSSIYTISRKQKNALAQELINGNQEIGNKLTEKILDRALDIEPTVIVNSGTRINVDVGQVLTLIPYKKDIPKEKYIRK